ncbi:pilin [Patescibacteria group bacterium]|nr:pilin [Patescibacteria group bacterium]
MYKIILFILIFALFLPLSASAFLDGPIVHCGTRKSGIECTLCDIFIMLKNIIEFLMELIIVIAPIFVLAGGVMILTAGVKPDQVATGKKMITSALVGIVIALASWIVLGTLFNFLADPTKLPWAWNEVECSGGGLNDASDPDPQPTDRCNQRSSPGPCLGGYDCQIGVNDQLNRMSGGLSALLGCMNSQLAPNAKEISSITDNSGGRCFTDYNGQCSGVDSCTGTCCGHSRNSLHYGGVRCRGSSYAVDFANETAFTNIRSVANTCANTLGLGRIDVFDEGTHVHVELDGLARSKGCI